MLVLPAEARAAERERSSGGLGLRRDQARFFSRQLSLSVTTINYLYDIGGGREHTVKVAKIFPDVPGLAQPFLLEATGRCPPEDIGGRPPGYAEFLAAIADPKHERHADRAEWHGTDFKLSVVDLEALKARVEAIANRSRAATTRRKAVKP